MDSKHSCFYFYFYLHPLNALLYHLSDKTDRISAHSTLREENLALRGEKRKKIRTFVPTLAGCCVYYHLCCGERLDKSSRVVRLTPTPAYRITQVHSEKYPVIVLFLLQTFAKAATGVYFSG